MYEIINLNLNTGDEKILLAKIQQILNHTRYMRSFVTTMFAIIGESGIYFNSAGYLCLCLAGKRRKRRYCFPYTLDQFSSVSCSILGDSIFEEFALTFSDGSCFKLDYYIRFHYDEIPDVTYTCVQGEYSKRAEMHLAYRCLLLGISNLYT